MTMVAVVWADKTKTTARNWSGLLNKVRSKQWTRYGDRGFRREISHRIQVWSGESLDMDTEQPGRIFATLESVGMLRIVRGTTPAINQEKDNEN